MTGREGFEQAVEENPLVLGLPSCERRVRGWLGVAEGSRSVPGCRAPRLVKTLSDPQLFLVFYQEGFLMEAFRFEHFQRLLCLAEGVLGCLGLACAMIDSAESRLEPLRRGFALLVLALRELEALPGGW